MKARASLYAGGAVAFVTYLLLAPFSCAAEGVPAHWGVLHRCSGFLAFEYDAPRNLLAPQAIVTAIVVGLLAAFFVGLIAARPKAPSGMKLIVALILVVLTLVSAASLGGVIVYAAPILIPSYWWMAYQSGRVARILWSLIAGLVAFYAWFVLTYMVSWSELVPLGALVVALGSSALVFLAPKGKEPDLWARP